MTPEETKEHLQRRLRELGWTAHIGHAGYEKVFKLTGGTEAGANQLCYKLISLGTLQESREVTDDMLDMAITDMARMEEIVQQSAKAASRGKDGEDPDLRSIEQLAAVLEAKMGTAHDTPETRPSGSPAYSGATAGVKQPSAAPLPKILVVDASGETRRAYAKALSQDFSLAEASNGAQAWKMLVEQPDIELVVTELAMPEVDGYALIKRVRDATAPAHVVGMPIIVATGPEDAGAKLRVLLAGANDFIIKNADLRELRARALARYKLSKTASRIPASPSRAERNISYGAERSTGNGRRKAQPARGAERAPRSRDVSITTLTAERRYAADDASSGTATAQYRRFSSATVITLVATALLAVAVAVIFYVGRSAAPVRTEPAVAMTPPPAPPAVEAEEAGGPVAAVPAPPPVPKSGGSRAESAPASPPAGGDAAAPAPERERPPARMSEPPAVAGRSEQPPVAGQSERPAPRTGERPFVAGRSEQPRPAEQSHVPAPEESERPRAAGQDERSVPGESERPPAAARRNEQTAVAKGSELLARIRPDDAPSAATGAAGMTERNLASETAPAERPAEAETPPAETPPLAQSVPREPVPEPARPAPVQPPPADPVTPPARIAAPAPSPSGGEVARVEPSPPPASPPPPAHAITTDELTSFVRLFASRYEAGDLDRFLGLFAENARTNDRNNRQGIRDDYASLFRTTDLREMKLSEMSWKVDGNQAYGWGDFDVKVRRRNEEETFAYRGSLTLVVEKINGRVRIVRLYHGQERVGS